MKLGGFLLFLVKSCYLVVGLTILPSRIERSTEELEKTIDLQLINKDGEDIEFFWHFRRAPVMLEGEYLMLQEVGQNWKQKRGDPKAIAKELSTYNRIKNTTTIGESEETAKIYKEKSSVNFKSKKLIVLTSDPTQDFAKGRRLEASDVEARFRKLTESEGRQSIDKLDFLKSSSTFIIETSETDPTVLEEIITDLLKDPIVTAVEVDQIVRGDAIEPNDYLWLEQWPLRHIHVDDAWEITTGAGLLNRPKVFVTDSGIDFRHLEFKDRIFTNQAEADGISGIDDDGNGYIDDFHGWDFHNNDNDPQDDHGHGTHVAGIVAAVPNNKIGIAGIHWNPLVIPCKCLGEDNLGLVSDCIKCLDYGVTIGATIMVNSFGTDSYMMSMEAAILAANKNSIPFICSAGNSGRNLDEKPRYPSSIKSPNIVSVGCVNKENERSSWSNFGTKTVSLGVPAEYVVSAIKGDNGMGPMRGTSQACPMVAGVAALIVSEYPHLTIDELIDSLKEGTDTTEALAKEFKFGGVLNARKALQSASTKHSPFSGNMQMTTAPKYRTTKVVLQVEKLELSTYGDLVFHYRALGKDKEDWKKLFVPVSLQTRPEDTPANFVTVSYPFGTMLRPLKNGYSEEAEAVFHSQYLVNVKLISLKYTDAIKVKTSVEIGESIWFGDESKTFTMKITCQGLRSLANIEAERAKIELAWLLEGRKLLKVEFYCFPSQMELSLPKDSVLDFTGVGISTSPMRRILVEYAGGIKDAEIVFWTEFTKPVDVIGHWMTWSEPTSRKIDLALRDNPNAVKLEKRDDIGGYKVQLHHSYYIFGQDFPSPLITIYPGFVVFPSTSELQLPVFGGPPSQIRYIGQEQMLVYPFWSDLVLDDKSEVWIFESGPHTAIQWYNLRVRGENSKYTSLNFQMVMSNRGVVLFSYQNMKGSEILPSVVGMRGAGGEHRLLEEPRERDWVFMEPAPYGFQSKKSLVPKTNLGAFNLMNYQSMLCTLELSEEGSGDPPMKDIIYWTYQDNDFYGAKVELEYPSCQLNECQ